MIGNSCKHCQKTLSANTKTISDHLKKHQLEKPASTPVPLITDHVEISKKSTLTSSEKETALRQLSLAIGTSSVPFSFTENDFFQNFCSILNPDFRVPCRQQISKLIKHESNLLHTKISNIVGSQNNVAVILDLWSKQTLGYFAIVLHFIDEDFQKNFCLLNLDYMAPPHSSKVVLDATNNTLIKWGFSGVTDHRIAGFVTDNGSNMIKAFENDIQEELELEDNESETNDFGEVYDSNDDSDEELFNTEAFFQIPVRIPCADHLLSNNLKKGIRCDILMEDLIKKSVKLMKKIKFSQKCADFLKEQKVTIVLPPPTRWLYFYEVFSCIHDNFHTLKHCAESILNIDWLRQAEKILVESSLKVFKLYKDAIKQLQSNYDVTLSLVFKEILLIKHSLELMSKNNVEISTFCSSLTSDIDLRFKFLFDPNFHKFKIEFSLSTYLDPRVNKYLKLMPNILNKVQAHLAEYVTENLSPVKNKEPEKKKCLLDELINSNELPGEVDCFNNLIMSNEGLLPIEFYQKFGTSFPQIQKLALKLFVIPASSSSVESTFSVASLSSGSGQRRGNLSDEMLTVETFLKNNKKYIN